MYKFIKLKATKSEKKILVSLNQTLKETKPKKFINQNIQIKKNFLYITNQKISLDNRDVYIAAWGKLSSYMTDAFIKNVGIKKIKKVCILSNQKNKSSKKKIVLKGNHPFPEPRTIRSSLKMLKFLLAVKPNDILIFLISGGGSSMFSIPNKTISVKEKILISKKLITRGIEPKLINNIRKFISEIKGGKLLKKLSVKKIYNICISDENENLMHSLASGSTFLQKWNFQLEF